MHIHIYIYTHIGICICSVRRGKFEKGVPVRTKLGTPNYVAPEAPKSELHK